MSAGQIGLASHSGSQINLRAVQIGFASHSDLEMRLRAMQIGFASHSGSANKVESSANRF
ncbi:hypothetical protein [Cytobacillus kochii]|uniref:hypothetical protein n=1 Tax=Cytobacillus kochii TaxID=859143 RepID=UPI00248183DA|nr:hypothetical protein [Cytobacillus kochii]